MRSLVVSRPFYPLSPPPMIEKPNFKDFPEPPTLRPLDVLMFRTLLEIIDSVNAMERKLDRVAQMADPRNR